MGDRELVILSSFKQKIYCNTENFVYCKSTKGCLPVSSSLDIKLNIIYEKSQIYSYASDENIKPDIEKLGYFLDHSCIIYIPLHKNRAVGRYIVCNLAKFKPYLYLNHSIFRKCSHYIFFCRTFNSYMQKNVYKMILNKISQDILKDNEQIFISCDTRNVPSQKGIVGAGFKKIGVLRYMSLFGLKIHSKLLPDGAH